MKLQYGKQYKTFNGSITGKLVVNPERTINYPFLDPTTGQQYTEQGEAYSGFNLQSVLYLTDDNSPTTLEEQNDSMKRYIKEVVTQMQKLRAIHMKHWDELPQSVKDYMAYEN